MRLNEFKFETVISIDMKLSSLSSNKPSSYYDQHSADIIKFPILKSAETYSHASQFTKHLSSVTLEGYTLLKIKKWWDTIISDFFLYLSINKICPL